MSRTGGPLAAEAVGVHVLRGRRCGCAVAFGPAGLLGVRILGADEADAVEDLTRSVAARRREIGALALCAPAGRAQGDLALLARHLDEGNVDLRVVTLDWTGASPFRVRVSELVRQIPAGTVRTYGELSRELSSSPRSVGRAMATNPFPVVVPCHRVVAAHHRPGGFSAPGGLATKATLLELEGGRLEPARAPGDAAGATSAQLALRY